MQTPQAMRRDWLDAALAAVFDEELATVTDDVQLVERIAKPVVVVEGDAVNIKVTRREDVDFAERSLSAPTGR